MKRNVRYIVGAILWTMAIGQTKGHCEAAKAVPMESAYTTLGEGCKLEKEAAEGEGDYQTFNCSGIGGYRLRHEHDDERENLVVLYQGQEMDLDFWHRVTDSFNSLGAGKIEWRLRGGKPVALIVRMLMDRPEGKPPLQGLIISKISPREACVVKVINASTNKDANDQARQAADGATPMACLWKKGSPNNGPIFR